MNEHVGSEAIRVLRSEERVSDEDASSDALLWRQVANAQELSTFLRAWLSITARSFPGIVRAETKFDGDGAGSFVSVAIWAASTAAPVAADFGPGAERIMAAVLKSRQPAIEALGGRGDKILAAYPLLLDDVLRGLVIVEMSAGGSARRLIRHLQWSSAWIEAFLRRQLASGTSQSGSRATALIDVVNATVSTSKFHDASHALATALARIFQCERATLGWRRGQSTRLVALLQSAAFERKYGAGRAIEAAMDEAIDQNLPMTGPAAPDAPYVALAHEALAQSGGATALLSVPLVRGDVPVGAVTLERFSGLPFTADEIALCDTLCAAAAPILADKRENEHSLPVLAIKRLGGFAQKLFGPRHLILKTSVAAGLAAIAFFSVATGMHRISARGQMQGEVRRVLSAPFDGYIRAQYFRAGQVVAENAVLAELQDNDLTLDRLRHVAQRRQYQLELDRALSRRDLAQASISRAQIDQKDAEIELADQMLGRTQIRAPFVSVVVSGDLSQSIGRPVSRGETLFELAPLDQYRVTIVVPEFDVQHVSKGQHGQVLLAALPESAFDFSVTNVTPVAHVQDGVNGFEVHGVLLQSDTRIRPGMEGLAKIDAGERKIVWIWTHGLLHWLRVRTWQWLPW